MKKRRNSKFKKELLSTAVTIACALLFRSVLASPYTIPSESMYPTLKVGDFLVATKYSYGLKIPFTKTDFYRHTAPKRGEIVLFTEQAPSKRNIIKRVVAVAGDHIVIENGMININGKHLSYKPIYDRSQVSGHPNAYIREHALLMHETLGQTTHTVLKINPRPGPRQSFEVPAGNVFVMGDNRDNSSDSRFWGPLPIKDIHAKARFIWLSIDRNNPLFTIAGIKIPSLRASRIGKSII